MVRSREVRCSPSGSRQKRREQGPRFPARRFRENDAQYLDFLAVADRNQPHLPCSRAIFPEFCTFAGNILAEKSYPTTAYFTTQSLLLLDILETRTTLLSETRTNSLKMRRLC
jgi:hypothetical protein